MARNAYLATVESGRGYDHPVEMRLIAPDGTVTDITYELQAERGSMGDCTGFVGVFSDVSSLRKLERDRMALERQRRYVGLYSYLSYPVLTMPEQRGSRAKSTIAGTLH